MFLVPGSSRAVPLHYLSKRFLMIDCDSIRLLGTLGSSYTFPPRFPFLWLCWSRNSLSSTPLLVGVGRWSSSFLSVPFCRYFVTSRGFFLLSLLVSFWRSNFGDFFCGASDPLLRAQSWFNFFSPSDLIGGVSFFFVFFVYAVPCRRSFPYFFFDLEVVLQ